MRLLSSSVVKVSFTKVDGTIREMWCTQDSSLIPETKEKVEGGRKTNESILAVWDMEKEGWRSFRKDSIISFDPKMKATA